MTAAKRNRIKRLLRSEIRNRASQQQKPQIDVVVVFTTSNQHVENYAGINNQINEAFERFLS